MRSNRTQLVINIAAKLLLLGLMAFAMANQDWEQFAGKAMGSRAPIYVLSAVFIPIGWLLLGRPRPYPHEADILMVSPFIVDTVGNYLFLYNRYVWFDDAAHAVTWMLLVMAVGFLILRLDLAPWNAGALATGFGGVSHIVWEVGEYMIMTSGATGLQLTYSDTVGDLALSLVGSILAGIVVGWRGALRRRRAVRPAGFVPAT